MQQLSRFWSPQSFSKKSTQVLVHEAPGNGSIGWTLTCETDEVKMFFTGALPPCGRFHTGHAPTGAGMVGAFVPLAEVHRVTGHPEPGAS